MDRIEVFIQPGEEKAKEGMMAAVLKSLPNDQCSKKTLMGI